MRLRTALDDLQAILFVDIPRSLRLVVLVVCVLVAYVTGLVWALAAGYQTEVVRLEERAEIHALQNQVKHLWGAIEYVKTGLDRVQLDGLLTPRRTREETPRRTGPGASG